MTQTKDFKRKKDLTESAGIYGMVPPQSRELETAVLGAILLVKDAFDTVAEILKPECFYVKAHEAIFRAMITLAGRHMPIDLFTLVEQLKLSGELEMVGGVYFISTLTNSVVSSANIESHSKIIQEKYIGRELIRISGEITVKAYDESEDILDTQSFADTQISNLLTSGESKAIEPISSSIVKTLIRMEELRKADSKITGIVTGFIELDKLTHGWQNTDLIILAARPSVGKTAMALNFAISAAKHFTENKKDLKVSSVAFFSLEMNTGQLIERVISAESGIDLGKIKTGDLNDFEMNHINHIAEQIAKHYPLYIDDTGSMNIIQLRAKCRRLKTKKNLGIIIIDYLQLLSGISGNKDGNREQEISKISRDLKALAKELDVPIIALSQLSREVEKRKESAKVPQLSDLRESGAIEQDADMVMFLYRPEYHDINVNEHGESTAGETHIKIAKHRNGSLDLVKLTAKLNIQKFYDMESGSGSFYSPAIKTYRPKNDYTEPKKNINEDDPF